MLEKVLASVLAALLGTIGHWFAKAAKKAIVVTAVAGIVRTGAVEVGEQAGMIPEDGYDNILQSFGHYTLQNFIDAKDASLYVFEATKDSNAPNPP